MREREEFSQRENVAATEPFSLSSLSSPPSRQQRRRTEPAAPHRPPAYHGCKGAAQESKDREAREEAGRGKMPHTYAWRGIPLAVYKKRRCTVVQAGACGGRCRASWRRALPMCATTSPAG